MLAALHGAGIRIWRLLVARRQLEQKQVADCAMVTLNNAREMLYRLLRAGFVSLQVGGALTLQPSCKGARLGGRLHWPQRECEQQLLDTVLYLASLLTC